MDEESFLIVCEGVWGMFEWDDFCVLKLGRYFDWKFCCKCVIVECRFLNILCVLG